MEIKPIETIYNGYRFRSRLEARWAVFFDAIGVKYDYEKEGYELGEAGYYLPDFWLPMTEENALNTGAPEEYKPCGYFIEIKGKRPTYPELLKCYTLAKHSKHTVKVFISPPGDHRQIVFHRETEGINTARMFDAPWLLLASLIVQLGYEGDINKAILKAKQARFEWGERG